MIMLFRGSLSERDQAQRTALRATTTLSYLAFVTPTLRITLIFSSLLLQSFCFYVILKTKKDLEVINEYLENA